ncbi:MAG: leucine-rich repeat domain-containing protein, partial [Mycoplasmataceae bacterium]|nr:leucine-rich repeat domain-containing protein [Mycoplasmataceae bacterium]
MLLITYVTYATSHNNSTPDPTPTPTQLKPIPFTDEYFIWTTYGDQLTVVDFKSGVDLSDYDTLSIPATWIDNGIEYRVIAIGNYAFYSNFELGSSIINLDLVNATNLQFINDYAFENCDSFTGSLTIPNSVNYIYDCAFEGCSGFNGTLTIGNSVINVGNRAFSRARFTNVINNSPNFNLADNVGSARVLINATSGTSLDYENGSVVGCIAFGQLTIPSSVTRIYRDLFCYCSGFIGTLTIPDSVTTIDDGAFERCNGFTSLTIGNSVTSIGDYAFYNCSGFTGSLTIPNS